MCSHFLFYLRDQAIIDVHPHFVILLLGTSTAGHSLYQSSFLLRDYGFDVEELPLDTSGNLPLDLDPKLAWAREHLAEAPIDVNRAARRELLRVPGIGPRGADERPRLSRPGAASRRNGRRLRFPACSRNGNCCTAWVDYRRCLTSSCCCTWLSVS